MIETPPREMDSAPLLVMKRIEKSFPGVRALRGVDLELHSGEVLGLIGENGAGKTTLIKVLSGAHLPDTGSISICGTPANIHTPVDAQRGGVAVIYQEFNLVPALSARENIFLGQERTHLGFLSPSDEHRRALALFGRIGVPVDPETPCRNLTIAQQQIVEIAKALSLKANILVMDEPTATLTLQEVERLFAVIRELKARGMGIIYISHRLDEVFRIADRVMVMRDGAGVGVRAIQRITRNELIEAMVGRKIENEFPTRSVDIGPERLVVQNLCRGKKVRDVSFSVRRGEVLSLTGLVGAGRTEVVRLIFGADAPDSGTITLDDETLTIRNPRDAIRAGICLLTEDRKAQGLVLGRSAQENFALPNLPKLTRFGFVKEKEERGAFARYIRSLRIKMSDAEQLARNLSGGNQQKLVLSKWLQSNSEVVIFDEPTRGIDVASKYEIYQLINELAAAGKAIIVVSSELPEVLGISDRILVMHEGRITGEIREVSAATQEQILQLAIG